MATDRSDSAAAPDEPSWTPAARPTRPPRPALPPRRASVLPDRRTVVPALLGATVAVVGVLLGIVGVLLLSDPQSGPGPVVAASAEPLAGVAAVPPALPSAVPSTGSPAVAKPSVPSVPSVPPPTAAAPAPLAATVLNNSRISGLADQAAAQLRSGGWPVTRTGSFRGRIPSTTAYYDDPASHAAAVALAARFDGIVRVRPRFSTLPAHGLVLVVTRDWKR